MKINVTIEIDDEELKKLIKNDTFKTIRDKLTFDETSLSNFARFFDDSSSLWTKDPEFNISVLRQQERYANAKLKTQGYLFLNDVYDMLGLSRSQAGQVVGWIYNEQKPIGDNFVSFGIYDYINSRSINDGDAKPILLDFNVDGNILDFI